MSSTDSDSDSVAAAWFAAFSSGALAQDSADDSPVSLLAVTSIGAPTITGARNPRNELRIEAYGAIDEANCAIGLARLAISTNPEWARVDATLLCVQNDLFDLGADLCLPATGARPDYEPLRVVQSQVDRLESRIAELSMDLQSLNSFVLPGGSAAAAALHSARATTLRAERRLTDLAAAQGETIGEPAVRYINRLSQMLFVAARYVNRKGEGDILWTPGQKA
ncbi:cob(I)yrinic acid a,c-diamide adenosyltransferase [Methylocapsa palsarum]|uniref:Corrinoid adenosyltransferase n=1 Tax=Methylocapsa palsarum TaxID=1612308 RepID=A0A1I4BS42_9HYPH|nr:cob(I)yrinic acid a,c-diamide adenosyltransferase [Methylocapsa palsarum]SFK71333.1 cob(I)alamin adenosyltransferase [Methylocapsa palsarum]